MATSPACQPAKFFSLATSFHCLATPLNAYWFTLPAHATPQDHLEVKCAEGNRDLVDRAVTVQNGHRAAGVRHPPRWPSGGESFWRERKRGRVPWLISMRCLKVTEEIEAALGKVVHTESTAEMFEEKVVVQNVEKVNEGTGSWNGNGGGNANSGSWSQY
eukprot:758185-Hanusia_phi.AAC.1